ncbi:tryptophan synthase subunit beta [Candidatus Peregrinibacteria bacterium]|nr:tryptophan synthase subunit beta [Candidatus Peregrinibacteria bacterium]
MKKVGYYYAPFGRVFGGMFVSELLVKPLQEVNAAFEDFKRNKKMQKELNVLLKDYVGRPTPLYEAKNLSKKFGYRLFLKREDLIHGGAHKTNNTVGQGLLAKFMGKKELIAETGAGQHGFAVALVGALLKIPVKIFMGAKDVERQRMNVMRMKLCGAEIISVKSGSQTLKDAINEALRYYVANSKTSYYLFGTVAGPHPFPAIVRYFQKIIGEETRRQIREKIGRLPDKILACVGGGSNAIGIFSAFLRDQQVKLIGVEAANGASLQKGKIGSLHGSLSYVLQDKNGQILESESIAAGLDYPGVGPEHSALKEIGRVKYVSITDREALEAFHLLCEEEGIIPALESAHAIAYAKKLTGKLRKNAAVIVNLSGRGDKDLETVYGSI